MKYKIILMNIERSIKLVIPVLFLFSTLSAKAQQVIEIKPTAADMTPVVRKALEGASAKDVKLVFAKGTYKFLPNYAKDKYCFITNHENGLKKIIFDIEGFNSIEIEGNGAQFIFHGLCAPFIFENCRKITLKDISIDWDIPFDFLGKVVAVNPKEEWRDIKPVTQGFSWKLQNGRLTFPNVDGFAFSEMGHTLAFNAQTKAVALGAWDTESQPQWVERRKDGILRFHEKLRHYPPVGSLLNSSGVSKQTRYAPAVYVKASKNIKLEGVVVHYSLGMGFLFERAEDITLNKCGVYLTEGSARVVASNADATHFCNCRGDILEENCRFENMLDDGVNVHGTYVVVDKVIDLHSVRVRFAHSQQKGFIFAEPKDQVWFIQQPNPDRGVVNEVDSTKIINDTYTEITFNRDLPNNLKVGDLLENKTWNPTFTMRGCTIRNNRARNVVLKTPLKTVIENNQFSSMMASILFRGESYFWFESGAVEDVLIQNNHFTYCAHGGPEHAVLEISPRLGENFDQKHSYDHNIRFINNKIETFDNRIVWADRVDGLEIKGNTIKKTNEAKQLYPNAPLFDFANCKNVKLIGNSYTGQYPKAVVADEVSRSTLKIEDNKGF